MAILYSGIEGTCQWTIDDQGYLYIDDGVISHNTTTYNDWSWSTYKNNIISVSSGNISWAEGANAYGMFHSCSNATSLDLSSFNTSNVTDMSYMFYNCQFLTSLDLSSFDTNNVINTNYMFYGCTNLLQIIVSKLWNVQQVSTSDSRYMFEICGNLRGCNGTTWHPSNIDKRYAQIDGGTSDPGYLTGFEMYASFTSRTGELKIFKDFAKKYTDGQIIDTTTYWTGIEDIVGETSPKWYSKRTSILTVNIIDEFSPKTAYQMFEYCKITSLDLSKLNTSNVTSMRNMFYRCDNLTSLDLSNFDTSNVTDMRDMFNYCRSLTSLDLSNFDTSNIVTSMSYMFFYCQSLISLDLSNFDTSNVTSMAYMFCYCQSLISLDLSNFDTSNVTDMSYMFYNCSNLKIILVSNLWNMNDVSTSTDAFLDCINIIGQQGTIYNQNHIDKTYAHIDYGIINPGYLTYQSLSPTQVCPFYLKINNNWINILTGESIN